MGEAFSNVKNFIMKRCRSTNDYLQMISLSSKDIPDVLELELPTLTNALTLLQKRYGNPEEQKLQKSEK